LAAGPGAARHTSSAIHLGPDETGGRHRRGDGLKLENRGPDLVEAMGPMRRSRANKDAIHPRPWAAPVAEPADSRVHAEEYAQFIATGFYGGPGPMERAWPTEPWHWTETDPGNSSRSPSADRISFGEDSCDGAQVVGNFILWLIVPRDRRGDRRSIYPALALIAGRPRKTAFVRKPALMGEKRWVVNGGAFVIPVPCTRSPPST